jgi:hypothetical protein
MLYSEVPIALLDVEDWEGLFGVIGRKICLALHYRCFRRPLSRNGRGFARVLTNAGEAEAIHEIAKSLPQVEIGRHGNEDLGQQVMIRWHASADGNLFIFVMHLQSMLFVIGMTGETERWRHIVDEQGDGFSPFP